MKAILVIDMPNDCYDCPCYDHEGGICQAVSNWKTDRENGCPLRPIPNEACQRLVEGLDAIEMLKSVEVRVVRRTE